MSLGTARRCEISRGMIWWWDKPTSGRSLACKTHITCRTTACGGWHEMKLDKGKIANVNKYAPVQLAKATRVHVASMRAPRRRESEDQPQFEARQQKEQRIVEDIDDFYCVPACNCPGGLMMFLMVCHREPSGMHHTPFLSPPRFCQREAR